MEEEMIEDYETIRSILLKRKDIKEKRAKKEKKILNENISTMKENELKTTRLVIIGINYELEQIRGKLDYLRPSIKGDKEYRLRQCESFENKIKKLIPDVLPFRFHGCPIYTAEQIIKSGKIVSSVDRIGFKTSYDEDKEISVTTKKDVGASVRGYANLKSSFCLPAGCVFVLLPEDEGEALLSESKSTINNVDFKDNPERLYAILTTPENLKRVREWCKEADMNLKKIYDFDAFIERLEQKEIVQDAIRIWQSIKNKKRKDFATNSYAIKNIIDDEER